MNPTNETERYCTTCRTYYTGSVCPHCTPIITAVVLFALPPLGILLTWLWVKTWSRKAKIIVSFAAAVWLGILLAVPTVIG